MVSPVITVDSNATVQRVASLLLQHRISAVPVVGKDSELIGIVSSMKPTASSASSAGPTCSRPLRAPGRSWRYHRPIPPSGRNCSASFASNHGHTPSI
ncbi:CBS domain-containing protein [Bradyrhizobium sp. B124]|uniref:CBS domain-containing protein n=1 Tax=Bradyrhizobium sp. B124 TaxID=3140245 RepID=UPI0031846475